jgi:hypothetical protein
MQNFTITLHRPDGTTEDWSRHALADVIRTAAARGGEDAVAEFFADDRRPPIDNTWISGDTIHLEAFDADADYENGTRWLTDNRG